MLEDETRCERGWIPSTVGSCQEILSWEVTWYLQLRKTRWWRQGGGVGEEAEWRQGRVLERFEDDLGETEVPSLGCSCRSLNEERDRLQNDDDGGLCHDGRGWRGMMN